MKSTYWEEFVSDANGVFSDTSWYFNMFPSSSYT